jgi:hypothetical protein
VKVLKKGTTFSIGTSSDLKLISNKKLEKLLGLKIQKNFLEFLLETSNWDQIWTRYLYLHLVTNSTHGEEFEVQIRNFLDLD